MTSLKTLVLKIEAHMLGVEKPDRALRSGLRKAQVQRVLAITPLMTLGSALCAAIIIVQLLYVGTNLAILMWGMPVLLISAFSLVKLSAFKAQPVPENVGTRMIENITIRMTFLGAWWGVMPSLFFYKASAEPNLLVISIISGLIGAGCLALNFIPSAMIGFVGILSLMSALGMAQQFTIEAATLCALLLLYTFVLIRGSLGVASSFAKTVATEMEISDKAETISMLLNEYEEGARDWLWEADADGNVTRGAKEFAHALGIDTSQWQKVVCLADPCKGENIGVVEENYEDLRQSFLSREPIKDVNFGIGFSNNKMHWFEVSGRPLFDKNHKFLGYRGFSKNRTSEMQAKFNIEYLAQHDTMTGLLNRGTFIQTLETEIAKIEATDHPTLAVLYIDLDGFKRINDSKGHAVGDALLAAVSKRLLLCSNRGGKIARLGGDEFAILVLLDKDALGAEKIAGKIAKDMSRPFVIDGNELLIGASIGIAKVSDQEASAETIISNADIALYHAKANGKGCYYEFNPSMHDDLKRTVFMREALEQAIDKRELTVAFQPFFEANSKRLAGFEALARWDHAELGEVPPSVFIPLAEEAGLIDRLGDWMLCEASRVATNWPPHLRLAVNVSVPQFNTGTLAARIGDILHETGLPADRLEIEITEGVFADDPEHVLSQIKMVKELGVSISLDDFGTGFSSLMYLINFPFDKLKIDHSFVKKAQFDKNARSVLTAIAELARRLDLKTTVEGIENVEQLGLLTDLRCDFVQGFHFGRPLAPADVAICIATDGQKMISDAYARRSNLRLVNKK